MLIGGCMNFFTSDAHFKSNDIIYREKRPFKNYKVFERKIIRRWNKQARKGDTIYFIGDFLNYSKKDTFSWSQALPLVRKIKADVVLILGNNEERVIKNKFDGNYEKFKNFLLKAGFKGVEKNIEISVCGQLFHLVHDPKNHKKGMLNLFGHTHRTLGIYTPFGFNVGCDLHHYNLLDENYIKFLIDSKKDFWDKANIFFSITSTL